MDKETQAFFSHEIEKLAQMTEKGMQEIRADVASVRDEVAALRSDITTPLDRIEKSHGYRLETLERDVANLKT
jgi:3-methyladenine DNA glycosylase Tag